MFTQKPHKPGAAPFLVLDQTGLSWYVCVTLSSSPPTAIHSWPVWDIDQTACLGLQSSGGLLWTQDTVLIAKHEPTQTSSSSNVCSSLTMAQVPLSAPPGVVAGGRSLR